MGRYDEIVVRLDIYYIRNDCTFLLTSFCIPFFYGIYFGFDGLGVFACHLG